MPDFMALIVIFALVTLCTKLVGGITSIMNGGIVLPIMLVLFCGLAYAHPFDYLSNRAHWDHERLGMVLFISLLAAAAGSLWQLAVAQAGRERKGKDAFPTPPREVDLRKSEAWVTRPQMNRFRRL